jgi:phosphatidylethanolamine-binding protein (PEBP) family uncharacterized protein
MRNALMMTTLACLFAAANSGCSAAPASDPVSDVQQADKPGSPFVVTSPSFQSGAALPAAYTCQDNLFGTGVTPQLDWTKGPKGTHSYAVVLHDISLSDPNLAYHWAAWNIGDDVRTLPAGIPGVDPSNPSYSNPFPDGLDGGQQAQARGFARYFAPCPDWVVRKAIKCNWPEPRPTPVADSYTFTVYALPDEDLTVPAYVSTVDPNYAHQLDAIFASKAIASAQIGFTSAAVPGAIADVGPFNCNNAP